MSFSCYSTDTVVSQYTCSLPLARAGLHDLHWWWVRNSARMHEPRLSVPLAALEKDLLQSCETKSGTEVSRSHTPAHAGPPPDLESGLRILQFIELSIGNCTDTNARWTSCSWGTPLSQLLPRTLSCNGGCFCSPSSCGRTSSGSWPAHRLRCLQRSRSSTLAAFPLDSWYRQGWYTRGLLGWVCFSC